MGDRRRALLLLLVVVGCAGEERPPPNVLVLVPDTVRADHVSVNGYPRETTPSLDALAREGANFTHAVTTAPRTYQSFATILTGLYPPRHGVRFVFDRGLAPGTPTLATLLRERGYETAAFDTLPFLHGIAGEDGFDVFEGPADRRAPPLTDADVMARVQSWVVAERDAPFLAFVRLTGAHWPYAPIEDPALFGSCDGHDHRFNQISLGVALGRRGQGLRVVDADAYRRNVWGFDYDEPTTAHMIAHYDAGVRRTDDLVGALVDSMRRQGLLDRTIVVVTSDHGESFGEHGYLHHGQRVDDVVMRVPLVLRLPADHPDAAAGVVVDQLVRTVDLLPTLLDAVGAPIPAGLDGTSLLPALRGERLPIEFAYGESGRSFSGVDPERHYPGVEGKHRMIRTAEWKLVRVPSPAGDEDRLYDLAADPGEHRDVAAREPEVARRLRAHLEAILALEGDEPARELSPGEREALRRLGYAE